MGLILDSWCFFKGVGKSEKIKASIFSGKAPAMALIFVSGPNGVTSGTKFLIHRNLLLTNHLNLPSISATETAEVCLQNGVTAALFPHSWCLFSGFSLQVLLLIFKKEFDSSFVGFLPDGAKRLVENTYIKLIGLDYLSFAAYVESPASHKIILKGRKLLEPRAIKSWGVVNFSFPATLVAFAVIS